MFWFHLDSFKLLRVVFREPLDSAERCRPVPRGGACLIRRPTPPTPHLCPGNVPPRAAIGSHWTTLYPQLDEGLDPKNTNQSTNEISGIIIFLIFIIYVLTSGLHERTQSALLNMNVTKLVPRVQSVRPTRESFFCFIFVFNFSPF